MIVDWTVSVNGANAPRTRFVEALRDRGVLVFEGSIFEGRNERGVPPVGAMMPRVVMQATANALTAKEQAGIVAAVREEVLAMVAAHLESDPASVDLLEAHYRITASTGLEIVVETHGLVDHVVRLSLN